MGFFDEVMTEANRTSGTTPPPEVKSANAQAGSGQVINTGTEVQAPLDHPAIVRGPAKMLTTRNIVIALVVVAGVAWLVYGRNPISLAKKVVGA